MECKNTGDIIEALEEVALAARKVAKFNIGHYVGKTNLEKALEALSDIVEGGKK